MGLEFAPLHGPEDCRGCGSPVRHQQWVGDCLFKFLRHMEEVPPDDLAQSAEAQDIGGHQGNA